MHSRSDQSNAVPNRDINPSEQLVAAYPDLACLLRNDAISGAFAGFEKQALRWKRIYMFFGRLSLIAVLIAMIFTSTTRTDTCKRSVVSNAFCG
jgi:hypothetical protein